MAAEKCEAPVHTLFMLIVLLAIIVLTGGSDQFDKAYDASRQGQVDEAIYHYSQALKSGDLSRRNQARALNNRAIAYFQKGLYDRALSDLQQAMLIAPEDLEMFRNRDVIQRANGTAEPASTPFQSASSGFPGGLRLQEKIKLFGLL